MSSSSSTLLPTDGIDTRALLLQTKASQFLQQQNIESAIAAFEEAMKIDPNSAIIILGKSAEFFAAKNYAECIKECDEELAALESRRQQIEDNKNKATALLSQSKEIAASAINEAIKDLKSQAKALLSKKNWGELLGVYEAWAQLEPGNPSIRYHMAVIYSKNFNWDLSVKQCDDGIALCKRVDPENKEHGETLRKLEEKKREAEEKLVGSGSAAATAPVLKAEKYVFGHKSQE